MKFKFWLLVRFLVARTKGLMRVGCGNNDIIIAMIATWYVSLGWGVVAGVLLNNVLLGLDTWSCHMTRLVHSSDVTLQTVSNDRLIPLPRLHDDEFQRAVIDWEVECETSLLCKFTSHFPISCLISGHQVSIRQFQSAVHRLRLHPKVKDLTRLYSSVLAPIQQN